MVSNKGVREVWVYLHNTFVNCSDCCYQNFRRLQIHIERSFEETFSSSKEKDYCLDSFYFDNKTLLLMYKSKFTEETRREGEDDSEETTYYKSRVSLLDDALSSQSDDPRPLPEMYYTDGAPGMHGINFCEIYGHKDSVED